MNFELPEHLEQLRNMLRRFVDKEMPRGAVAQWDADNHFPRDVFDKLAALGVMGMTVPEEYGGSGRDIIGTMMVIEELSRRSMAVAIPYIMAACYAGMNLAECGSGLQKQEYLPRVASGELIFAYGWTEPDVGGDLASVRTVARREGDEIVISGSKRFCSGAEFSDYIYTLVCSDPAGERYRNLSLVMIPTGSPGISIQRMASMGIKGVPTTDVSFDNVRVPVGLVMGGEDGWNQGWQMLTGAGLDVEKLEVAAMAVGIAAAALDDAAQYALERTQFGKAIGAFQSVQHKLADMRTHLEAARLMLYRAAWLSDRHQSCALETSMAKLFATEAGKTIALEAQTILGAYGYVRDFDIERYVRDSLLMPIIGGSSAIQRNNIAKLAGYAVKG
ncbi:acyl-CoA dehydrogenase [Sphingobium lactosutens]|uniref:acyl-CoA dehydrogenase family protein n=1 Tax=Sphingobium lactosutens TaxID=522773 RepID=UPI0015BB6F20|nr:acyl-CoA dehydrogenase family protein [Sphingobium lactosutens]NWK97449.1 acyl-CoA dehydrogenase [Sphingobium lactosutens]